MSPGPVAGMNMGGPSSKMDFRQKTVLLFILATVAFYLFTEHRAHILAYSSYIILFFYVLLHLFMHRGHGGHGRHGRGSHGPEQPEHGASEYGVEETGNGKGPGQHEHSSEENKL